MNLCMPVSAVRENPNAEIIPRAAKYLMGFASDIFKAKGETRSLIDQRLQLWKVIHMIMIQLKRCNKQ